MTAMSLPRAVPHRTGELIQYLESKLAEWSPPVVLDRRLSLVYQGRLQTRIYYLRHGFVKLVRHFEDGTEVIIGLQSSGFVGGMGNVLLQNPSQIGAITCTEIEAFDAPTSRIVEALHQDLRFGWAMHLIRSVEHEELLRHHARRANPDAVARVLDLIRLLSSYQPENRLSAGAPLRNWEMAQLIGVTPEHLSRLFRKIKKGGLAPASPLSACWYGGKTWR